MSSKPMSIDMVHHSMDAQVKGSKLKSNSITDNLITIKLFEVWLCYLGVKIKGKKIEKTIESKKKVVLGSCLL